MKKSKVRNRILHRASRLFFRHGFSTGVDTVTLNCQVAKMSIYRYFPSKDELICQVIAHVQKELERRIVAIVEDPARSARQKLSSAFHELCSSIHEPELMGALSSRALIEFPHEDHPVHGAAIAFKRWVFVTLERLIVQSGGSPIAGGSTLTGDAQELAKRLLLLLEGCFSAAPALGVEESRRLARALGEALIGGQ